MNVCSLHATKVFHTAEGGLIIYKNKDFEIKYKNFQNFGISDIDYISSDGLNGKISEFHSAVGLSTIDSVSKEIQSRALVAEQYIEYIDDNPFLTYIKYKKLFKGNFQYFPVIVKKSKHGTRDQLYDHLKEKGIEIRKYFTQLNTTIYQDQSYKKEDIPRATLLSQEILCLPIHSKISQEQIEFIISAIKCFYE